MEKVNLRRGGAHNSANRHSYMLRQKDCETLVGASYAAWHAGLPFNRYITTAWGKGHVPAHKSVVATGLFVRGLRDWLRQRGRPMPWVWVQESGRVFGQHAHILLHVSPDLAPLFRSRPLAVVKNILPGRYVAGVLQTQRLRFANASNYYAYEAELLGKLHYMLKCAPNNIEKAMGMDRFGRKDWGQRCPVLGKRAAVWQGWQEYHLI